MISFSCTEFLSTNINLAFFSSHTRLNTSKASCSCGYIITGTFSFIIPDFSSAIFSKVSPNICIWSKLIDAITQAIGVITFVESCLPPSPTSITAKSTPCSQKYKNIAQVIISNSVGLSYPSDNTSFTAFSTLVIAFAKSSFWIFVPFICILSSNSSMKGDVYIPTLYPALISIFVVIALIEPLPFVPAICIHFILS